MLEITPIIPEIGLIILAAIILIIDLIYQKRQSRLLGWLTVTGLAVIAVVTVTVAYPPMTPVLVYGGMLRFDQAGFLFTIIFLVGAAITSMFALEHDALSARGEFYILLLIATLGMCLMSVSADMIMLYLAIETTSIPLFVMAGFITRDQKSVEAGIKYLLFGAMSSTVMVYGFSLLYGFSGTTQLYALADSITNSAVPLLPVIMAMMLVLVGFAFKISAVPFHFWAPDVYEGSPTPVAGFLSTASKAAGFAVLLRVFLIGFPGELTPVWTMLVAILATASMFLGNLLALAQKNIKRLLAYSSIAQAGYILIGVASNSAFGTSGAIYYLAAYLFTNLAAFGVVTIVSRVVGSDEISAYAGLSRRSPALALAMLVAILSLGGIPPFAGFVGKLLVFAAAIEKNLLWLAIVGIINSIVALYYYLVVLKVIYAYRSEDEGKPLSVPPTWATAVGICIFGVILLGVVIAPLYDWSGQAAHILLAFR